MIATRSIFTSAAVLALALSGLAAGHVSAQTTLLDTITDADGLSVTGSTPHTYMGDGFTNNNLAATTTSFQITQVDMFFVSLTATTYTDIVGRIQFWNTANGNGSTTSTTNPAFSNAAGGLITADFGAGTPSTTNITEEDITLTTPITLIGGNGTDWGFAQNFQSSTAAAPTLADNTNLESIIGSNSSDDYAAGQIVTGVDPTYGYFRNANGETNFNFTSTSRSLGYDYQGVAIVLIGNELSTPAPEPSSIAAMAVGGLVLGGAVYRKRRRRA